MIDQFQKSLALFLFLLIFVSTSSGFCQEIGAKTKPDDAAILFQFNGFSNLSTGGLGAVVSPTDASGANTSVINGIGGKYFYSDNLALRGSLTFVQQTLTQDALGAVAGFEESQTALGFEAGIEVHLHNKRLSPYFGGIVGYSRSIFSRTQGESKSTATIKGYGGAVIGGAEFFLVEQLSLSAEYRAVFQSQSGVNELSNGVSIETPKVTTLGFFSQVYFTLGMYLW